MQLADSLRYHDKDMSDRHFLRLINKRRHADARFNSQSGQIAVVIFLIMAVLLVVGLSLAGRTSKEVELAGQQEDTTRVFNAAETGVEQALSDENNFDPQTFAGQTQITKPINLDSSTNTAGTITITPETTFQNTFNPGETASVFIDNTKTGNLNIIWEGPGNCPAVAKAALVVTVYSNPSGTGEIAENYGVTPQGCNTGTNFTPITMVNNTYTFTLPFGNGDKVDLVRIKPLFKSTQISVTGGVLAPQAYDIRSQAQDTSTGNTEVRAIQVTRQKPAPPSLLDYAIYSGDTLTK